MPVKLKEKEEDKQVVVEKKKIAKFPVHLARMGADAKSIEVAQGTSLGEFAQAHNIDKLEIRVNGQSVTKDYMLKENDLVVAVPDAIRILMAPQLAMVA